MAVEDIITEDIIQLYLKGEEIDCFLGDVILSRVAPYRKGFVSLTPLIESIYLIHAMPLKEYFYRYPADRRKGFISGFDVLDFFYNDKNYPKSLDEVKKALKNKLKHIELSIDFRTLPNRIDTHHSVKEAFPEIINFDFLTNRDHEETRELLEQLWGSYPRKDLDGATLDEVHPVGLKEQSLMNLFNILVKENINSKDYSSLEDANKALHEFREGWIDAPLNMMKEKTPRQIILDERKSLNNQSKEIELNIELEREIDYDRNLADKLYNEGLHLFNQGTLVGAADCFGQVTKMYPDIYRAWGNLGASYAYLGDKKLAGQCFRKALSLQPDYEFAKQCLDFIKDKSVKQLSLYGISGALLRVMHDAGKNKKKDDKELNVWDELDKKFKELGDQKNR